jgi:hypothetical protein
VRTTSLRAGGTSRCATSPEAIAVMLATAVPTACRTISRVLPGNGSGLPVPGF